MPGVLDRVQVDEGLARAELRRQIAKLEREISRAGRRRHRAGVASPHRVGAAGPPRVLDLGELEEVRDALADAHHRGAPWRSPSAPSSRRPTASFCDEMLAAPARYPWVRISRADVGEPGCGHWHSRPVLGPLGMLMGWWRVKVSSGCPTAGRLAAASHIRTDERPPAPWGNAPLAELAILAGIVCLAIGVFGAARDGSGSASASPRWAAWRWRSVSISPAIAPTRPCSRASSSSSSVGLLFYLAGLVLAYALPIGAVCFAVAFYLARRAFQRASGGLSFRVGGMRG